MNGVKKNYAILDELNRVREAALASKPHDWTAFRAMFADDFVEHNTAWHIETMQDLTDRIEEAMDKFALVVKIVDTIAQDDKIVIMVEGSGVHRKTAFGFPPTNKKVKWQTVEIYRFNDSGKIAEMWYFTNILELYEQLGFKLPAKHKRL